MPHTYAILPIPFERDRFFVWSRRTTDCYIVDVAYAEEPWMKPKVACGCVRHIAYGECCVHMRAVMKLQNSSGQLPQLAPPCT